LLDIRIARVTHECRREAFMTETRRSLSHVWTTKAQVRFVEKAEQEKRSRARASDDVAGLHE
jgi:hypothetical protein